MNEEYDVDKIVDGVEKAVLAGKSRHATEKESLELRLAALENIAGLCKEQRASGATIFSVQKEEKGGIVKVFQGRKYL